MIRSELPSGMVPEVNFLQMKRINLLKELEVVDRFIIALSRGMPSVHEFSNQQTMIISVLNDFPLGLLPAEIAGEITKKFGRTVSSNSIRPQLARLKKMSAVYKLGQYWKTASRLATEAAE